MRRHLLLFDLNGTLCSKTRERYATKGGKVRIRPYVKEMLNVLSEYYDLGIYSSATYVFDDFFFSLSHSLYTIKFTKSLYYLSLSLSLNKIYKRSLDSVCRTGLFSNDDVREMMRGDRFFVISGTTDTTVYDPVIYTIQQEISF